MSRIVEVSGNSVRNCLAAVRRKLGLKLSESREEMQSGGEDGLYRVHLSDGTIAEVSVIHRAKVEVHSVH